MAELLPWFPYVADEWDERTRELSHEQEGALMRLVRHAWRDPDPCTIADSDAAFDRVLGSRWKKLLPFVRQHFTPLADRPGRLRCEWLFFMYTRQLAKHHSYQERGGKGGRPRRPESSANSSGVTSARSSANSSAFQKRRNRKPQLEAEPEAQVKAEWKAESRENTAEGKSSGPSRAHRAFPPPAGALAPEDARAAGEATGPPFDSPYAVDGPRDWSSLITAAFPAEATRRAGGRAAADRDSAMSWYAQHPELAIAIAAALDAFPARTDDGRDRVRTSLIVDAWRRAGSPATATPVAT